MDVLDPIREHERNYERVTASHAFFVSRCAEFGGLTGDPLVLENYLAKRLDGNIRARFNKDLSEGDHNHERHQRRTR